jgi:hypothetical protein
MNMKESSRKRAGWRGWLGMGMGIAALWFLVFVALPLGQRLPLVAPIMQIIAEADINAGSYWYTQSEETTQGAMHVRNALAGVERRRLPAAAAAGHPLP